MLNEESVMPDFETEFEAVEPGLHLLCRESVETTASGECGEDASRLYRKGRVHLCDEHVDSRWAGMREHQRRLVEAWGLEIVAASKEGAVVQIELISGKPFLGRILVTHPNWLREMATCWGLLAGTIRSRWQRICCT